MVECNGIKALQCLSAINIDDHDTNPALLQKAKNYQTIYMTFMKPKLQHIPPALIYCQNLVQLSLEGNELRSIPQVVCDLYSLKILTMTDNQLKEIPPAIEQLTNLKDVNFSENEITDFSRICKCLQIQYLSLSFNKIAQVPISVANLQDLRGLSLGDNLISALPDEICKLGKLEILYLHGNRLTHLPLYIDNCISLKTVGGLVLFNNPLVRPPIEVSRGGRDVIFQYFKDLRENESRTRKQQVVILGETGAGKTSLALTLMNKSTHLAAVDDRTHVLDKYDWQMKEDLKVRVTDFGGHHVYKLAHNFFLCSDVVALLVFNFVQYSSEVYDVIIGRWLRALMSKSCRTTIIVVGTHSDCCRFDEIESKIGDISNRIRQQQQRMSSHIEAQIYTISTQLEASKEHQNMDTQSYNRYLEDVLRSKKKQLEAIASNFLVHPDGIFAISSTSSMHGISDLESKLVSCCEEKAIVLPKTWLAIQDMMNDDAIRSKTYLGFDEYCGIVNRGLANCGSSTEHSLATTEALLSYQHQSGDLIWYKHDEHLKPYIFHRPEVIIGFLKSIFHHDMEKILHHDNPDYQFRTFFTKVSFEQERTRFLNLGQISRKLLRCLVKRVVSDDGLFQTMIHLLKKFSLCFEFPGEEDDSFRFPWFLTNNRPDIFEAKWPPISSEEHVFQVEFHFPLQCPEGLYELAVVNLQMCLGQYLQDSILWKDGAFFQKDHNTFLISRKDVQSDSLVVLAARGPNAKPLWSKLLSAFNCIVALLEMWPGTLCGMFYLCPHCLKYGLEKPTLFPAKNLLQLLSVEKFLPCRNSQDLMVPIELVIPTGKLDVNSRTRLLKKWEAILYDMSADDMLPPLVSAGIITPEMCQEIRQQQRPTLQNEKLLMQVLDMDVNEYKTFVDILARDHSWLVRGLLDGDCFSM